MPGIAGGGGFDLSCRARRIEQHLPQLDRQGIAFNRLIKIIREFYEYAIQEEVLPFYGPDAARTQFEQHLEILDALRARDADRAEAAMRRHIGDVRVAVTSAIRDMLRTSVDLDEVDSAVEREMDRLSREPTERR